MANLALLLGISLLLLSGIFIVAKTKQVPLSTLISLFLFGVLFSVPFIMVEYLGSDLRFYLVLPAFIFIELGVLFLEHHIKAFHELIHHNVRHLRITSFILIGIGFTWMEVVATILSHQGAFYELLVALPLKATFGIFIHTVLTSLSSLVHVGVVWAEDVLETIFQFLNYYLRIVLISLSHYFYVFFAEHHFSLYALPFIAVNLVLFFWVKNYIDKKQGRLPD